MGVAGDRGPGVHQGNTMLDVSVLGPGGSALVEVRLWESVARP